MADEDKKVENGDTAATNPETPETGAPQMGGNGDASTIPQAGMLAQYVKDLSFENPNAPQSLQRATQTRPGINLNVNVAVEQLSDDNFEVLLRLEATAKHDEDVAFIVDLSYAGLFAIRNVPRDAMQPFLLVEAPHLLFPFARRVLADAVRDGGFSPLMLEPIDFAALYRQQLAQQGGNGNGGMNLTQGGIA